jgi:putative endonuclease
MRYVYILKSEKSGRYYVGRAADLPKRLKQHNDGKTRSLKAYLPMQVVHVEEFSSKQEAYRRERRIKSYKGGEAFKRLLDEWKSRRDGRAVECGGLENR